jgi:hypothetical protein
MMASGKMIEARLDAPAVVHIPAEETVQVDVLCRLHNAAEHDWVVGASHPDDVHNWHVLGENHREVMRPPPIKPEKPGKDDPHPYVSQAVGAGRSLNVPQTLTLSTQRLKPGKTYTIRYEFWGEIAEATFVAVPSHEPPPVVKKKRTVKSKTASTTKAAANTKTTTKAATRKRV